jgi:hypothetical protein
VQVYNYSDNRALVRVNLGATDLDSSQTYTATLTKGAVTTSFNLTASGGSLVGLANLDSLSSASDYVLTVKASGGNVLTKPISANSVFDEISTTRFNGSVVPVTEIISPVNNLAIGREMTASDGSTIPHMDAVLASSFGVADRFPNNLPTFIGKNGNDVLDGLAQGMAFAGGLENDTAIMKNSALQMADNTGTGYHYEISMLPTAEAAAMRASFEARTEFVTAIEASGFAANQSAFVGIAVGTGMAYTNAENLVFANSEISTGSGSTGVANVFLLGRDAANALQLQLSDTAVRLVAGAHADNILAGASNDVIVGNGNGNGALINGVAEAADIIRGGAGHDILAGGSFFGGQDKSVDVSFLFGDQGDDVLVAVSGDVTAEGGSGRDVFALFSDTDHVNLIIKDFNATTDRIDLSALVNLKASVLSDTANSLDSSAALRSIMSSAITNSDGSLVLNFDAYLSADAKDAGHQARITVHQASANDGQLSTQNFVFSEMAWSPLNWHDNLNPLI